MENKRVALWDNLKFELIVLVVLGHFINIRDSVTYHSIFIFIYSFHMPLFVFLAGLFHRNKGFWKKSIAYLAIYIMYELGIYGIKKAYGVRTSLDILNETAAPWFMLALAFYVLAGFALHKLMEDRIMRWVILVAMTVLACVIGFVESVGEFLSLAKVIYFFPFYLLGMITDRKKLEFFAEKTKFKLAGAVVLAGWLLICFVFMKEVYQLRPFLLSKASYPENYDMPVIWRLQCYLMACITGLSLIVLTPVREIKPFTLWGSRTIQVYFWHKFVLYVFQYTRYEGKKHLDDWFYEGGLRKLLWMGVAVAVTCILSLWIFRYPTELILAFTRTKKDAGAE